jgi:hypothetical protein
MGADIDWTVSTVTLLPSGMPADTGSLLLLLKMPPLAACTYLAAAPAIHSANGQGRHAWKSVGLRLGIPLTAAGLGLLALSGGSCNNSSELGLCGAGLLVGALALGAFVMAGRF